MADTENPSSINRFRWLIVCMANSIESNELNQAKLLVRDRLGTRNYDSIKVTIDFFDILQEGNHFHEGDTMLLRHILVDIGRIDLVEELNKYIQEYAVVARHYRKHPAASEEPFIGRQNRLDELFDLLQKKHEHGVATICISGLPGMGKTRLAKEACYRQLQYHELLFVDLRELVTTESILYAVMHALGKDTPNVDINILIFRLRKYRPEKAGGGVLLFDNADRPLQSPKEGEHDDVYSNFVDLLERIILTNNEYLKVIITTRMGLPPKLCKHKCIIQISIKADELDYDDAKDILQYYAGRTIIDDDDTEQLINLCGKCPLALKVTGSRLQDQTIPPKELIGYLNNKSGYITSLGLCRDTNLEACLNNTFYNLPDKQKHRMVRLSTIPGTFTSKAALAILGLKRSDKVQVNLQLQDLKYRNLIEASIDDNEDFNKSYVRYGIHLLLREFLQRTAKHNESLAIHYNLGEQEFVGYFLKQLLKIGKLSEKKYKKALKTKNDDAVNFQELLTLLPKQAIQVETRDWQQITTTIELFYSTKERLKFFEAQRSLEHRNNNVLAFVEMSAYEGLQKSRLGLHYSDIVPLFENAERMLLVKSVKKFTDEEKDKLVLLYQLWGNVCTTCTEDLDKAKKRMDEAYKIVHELKLKNTNTARFYSTMGDVILNKSRLQNAKALCEKSKVKDALKFYKMAYDLRQNLTGSENHPDIPVYLVNIGSCYYQLEDIQKAIDHFKSSLRVEDGMMINNEESYLKTIRNLALAYRDIDRYEDAIDFGERCIKRRVDLLGVHQDTARIWYLVGLFYMERKKRGDLRDAERCFEEALRVEEQLWKTGKPHSVDWNNLKRGIKLVLVKGQKSNYPVYKKRFDRAEKKSEQRALSQTDEVSSDSSDTSSGNDGIVPDDIAKEWKERERKRTGSSSSDSDMAEGESVASRDTGISSMGRVDSQETARSNPKVQRKNPAIDTCF